MVGERIQRQIHLRSDVSEHTITGQDWTIEADGAWPAPRLYPENQNAISNFDALERGLPPQITQPAAGQDRVKRVPSQLRYIPSRLLAIGIHAQWCASSFPERPHS